jgi:hypothetical protein
MKKVIGLIGLLIWISFLTIFIAPNFADKIAKDIWFPHIPKQVRDFKNNLQEQVLQTWTKDIKNEIWESYNNLKDEAEKLKQSVWDGLDWVINKLQYEKNNFDFVKWDLEDELQSLQK